jgi:hypothetical protein
MAALALATLLGGCSTSSMSEPQARTVTGDYQKIGACTYQALDRAYPGLIKIAESANTAITMTYDVAVGEVPYREFEATVAKTADGVASVTVKERQTLGGTIDRFTRQIITAAETCAAELAAAPTPPVKRKQRSKQSKAAEIRSCDPRMAGSNGKPDPRGRAGRSNDVCSDRHHEGYEPSRRTGVQPLAQRHALGAPEADARSMISAIVDVRF